MLARRKRSLGATIFRAQERTIQTSQGMKDGAFTRWVVQDFHRPRASRSPSRVEMTKSTLVLSVE